MRVIKKAVFVLGIICILSGIAFATAKSGSPHLENNGFENGRSGWTFKPAADYAEIKVIKDVRAPEGNSVLHIRHERTRTSEVSREIELLPYATYLLSFQARKGENYLRSGMGLFIRIYNDGREVANQRFDESELGEEWQTVRKPLATGISGTITVRIFLSSAAGEVFIDNLRVVPCSRERIIEILGTGYIDRVPYIPLKPGQAAAQGWGWKKISVSARIPSRVNFGIRENIAEDIWEKSKRLVLELPKEIEILSPGNIKAEDVGTGYKRYTLTGKAVSRYSGRTWWSYLLLGLRTPLKQASTARFWVEWEGGRQETAEVDIQSLDIPVYPQPGKIITGTQNSPMLAQHYGENYPAIMKSLGFNFMTYWALGAAANLLPEFKKNNIVVETEHSGVMVYDRKMMPDTKDAWSTDVQGNRVQVFDPLHRGEIFKKFLSDVRSYGKAGFRGIQIDDEYYNDWRGINIDMSERTKKRWRKWLKTNRPDLTYVEPEVLYDDPLNYEEQYQAWWLFRASLFQELYDAVRDSFFDGVKESGNKSGKQRIPTIQDKR